MKSEVPLRPLVEKGHYDMTLTPAEVEKVACGIDLRVPFCGDDRHLRKRQAMERGS